MLPHLHQSLSELSYNQASGKNMCLPSGDMVLDILRHTPFQQYCHMIEIN